MGRALAVALVATLACNGDRKGTAPVGPNLTGDAGSAAARPAPGPLPENQRCLWLNVCDQWSGCAHIEQVGTGWKVITAERFARGDSVEVLDMCTGEPVCIAAHGYPKGVICPPHTVPPIISEPDYTCEWTGAACVSAPRPPKPQP